MRATGFSGMVLVSAGLFLLAGCGGGGEKSGADGPAPEISIEFKEEAWVEEGCTGADCAAVTLRYPVITEGPDLLIESVESFVMGEILRPAASHGSAASPDRLAAAFLADYVSFKKENPRSAQVWKLDRQVEILPCPPGLISFRATKRIYSGGAHENESVDLATFDRRTGKRIALGDILEYGYHDRLTALGEKNFRGVRGVADGESLSSAGFTFDKDLFRLGGNFAVVDEGLVFHYNPYEIAPYSLGATDFSITVGELGDLLIVDHPWSGTEGK